jgi:hypothetical protein
MVEGRKEAGGWKTTVLNNNHNHGPVAALSALPQYRIAAITPDERLQVKTMHTLGYSPTQILNTLRHGNPENILIPKDIYNLLATLRTEELGGQTPIQWLLKVHICVQSIYLNLLTNPLGIRVPRFPPKSKDQSRDKSITKPLFCPPRRSCFIQEAPRCIIA